LDETAAPTPAAAAPSGISPFALVLLAGFLALGAALATLPQFAGPLTFAFVMLGWVVAVALHEFGHAFTAHLAGDHTVAAKGYLSLDPRRYADLGTSLVIPLIALALGGVGFPGGAVYLRDDLMRSRAWRSAASLAGPLGTLVVLVLISAALHLMTPRLPGEAANPLVPALAFLAFLQATALILNLLPIPGLDGFNVLRPWLPRSWRGAVRKAEALAMIALLALVFFVPGASAVLFGLALLITDAAAVPVEAIQQGYATFRFWA
jgi:Zn-dependent protease